MTRIARRNSRTLSVDSRVLLKAADRCASGSLYGLDVPGAPPQHLLEPLRPKNFTQKAPDGQQRPGGDAAVVAAMAAAAGASVTVRLADYLPDFPYVWPGLDEWLDMVRRSVLAVRAARVTNLYAFELWNEPNWTWSEDAPPFFEVWALTFKLVQQLEPGARILGPCIERWDIEWMTRFLDAAKNSGTIPDIIGWHVLDPGSEDDIDRQVREYRELETQLRLAPLPISINEYGAIRDLGTPGQLVRFIAALERAGVDTANLAYWHREGRLADLVTARGLPTSAWWVFAWYGDMNGSMVEAESGDGAPNGFACLDLDGSLSVVASGRLQKVRVIGIRSGALAVECESVAWRGPDGAAESVLRYKAVVAPSDGVVTLEMPAPIDPMDAVRFRLTPTEALASAPWTIRHGVQRDGGLSVQPSRYGAEVDMPAPSTRSAAVVRAVTSSASWVLVESGEASRRIDLPDADQRVDLATTGDRIVVRSDGEIVYCEAQPWSERLLARDAELTFSGLVDVDVRANSYAAHRFVDDAYVSDGNFDSLGSTAEWTIHLPVTGVYRLTVGYANGGRHAAIAIVVDGEQQKVQDFPPTQGWGVVGSECVNVIIAAGTRRIAFSASRRGGRIEYNYVDVALVDLEKSV